MAKNCPFMSSGKPDRVKCDEHSCELWIYNPDADEHRCAFTVMAQTQVELLKARIASGP